VTVAKTAMARRNLSAMPSTEDVRQAMLKALGFEGKEAEVLAEVGSTAREILTDKTQAAADRLRAAERLVDWIGPRPVATHSSEGGRAPLVALTVVAAPQPAGEVIEAGSVTPVLPTTNGDAELDATSTQ
jgi:hypothetical protein